MSEFDEVVEDGCIVSTVAYGHVVMYRDESDTMGTFLSRLERLLGYGVRSRAGSEKYGGGGMSDG
jgi:hypothetical protein